MIDWRHAQAHPPIAAGEVHLWRLRLAGDEASARALLSADEVGRADAFRFDRDRRQFTLARGSLRRLLGRYLRKGPAALAFDQGPQGKPSLAGEAQLRFNLSHSGALALIAVALDREVGADVEVHRPELDVDGIAPQISTPAELSALRGLAPGPRRETFFGLWTRKEAVLKALGSGLSVPLQEIELSVPAPTGPYRASIGGRTVEVLAIDAGAGLSAAVADEGGGARISLFEAVL